MNESIVRKRFLAALAGAGVIGAAFIPGFPVGINFPLTGAAVIAAVLAAKPAMLSIEATCLGTLGSALVLMMAIRSAPWVLAADLLVALGLACLAVGGASSWVRAVRSVLSPVMRLIEVPRFLANILPKRKSPSERRPVAHATKGIALAAPLLIIFGSLFASADPAFAHLVNALIPRLGFFEFWSRLGVFLLVAVGTAALVLAGPRLVAAHPGGIVYKTFSQAASRLETTHERLRRLKTLEWSIPLVTVNFLFGLFIAVQVSVLFGGNSYVLQTEGLTYAEYAREGFFQLIFASALTLGVVALASIFSARPSPKDASLLRILLAALCVLTLVVLASSLRRLGLYEQAFGFTSARMVAHAVIYWIGGLLVSILATAALRRPQWLPRAAIGFTSLGLLVLTIMNPDAMVANRNIERFRYTGKIDSAYLSTLSPDAAPAIMRLPPTLRKPILESITKGIARDEPWSSWNYGRARARNLRNAEGLEALPRPLSSF